MLRLVLFYITSEYLYFPRGKIDYPHLKVTSLFSYNTSEDDILGMPFIRYYLFAVQWEFEAPNNFFIERKLKIVTIVTTTEIFHFNKKLTEMLIELTFDIYVIQTLLFKNKFFWHGIVEY